MTNPVDNHQNGNSGDEEQPEKVTAFRVLTSNGNTEICVKRWQGGSVVLNVSSLDATIEEELTPHEALRLVAAILPGIESVDPATRKRGRLTKE